MKSGGAKPELNAVAIQGAAVLRPYKSPMVKFMAGKNAFTMMGKMARQGGAAIR